jgi:serine/threonine-protein kinase
LLLILLLRGLFSGPNGASVVVDVTPPAARVTLDGEPLNALQGLRKRAGLMPGEHVLAAEHGGFVRQRRVFTLESNKGDRRIVLTLEREAPPAPPPIAAEPEPEPAPAPATLTTPPTADKAEPQNPRELARQRRLERYRARRAAAAAAREARSSRSASADAPRPRKAAGTPGLLKLNSVPWAEVYIDKRHVGHTPLMGLSLPAGKHVVRLENPSLGLSKTVRVKLPAGETVTQVVKL